MIHTSPKDPAKPSRESLTKSVKLALMVSAIGLAASCTYVPYDTNRSYSAATDVPAKGSIATTVNEITRANGGRSTFIPLVSGTDALSARLRLIEQAERTLDIQYFLIKPDLAGGLFSRALIQAAERGVRVRFLLDDVFTTATDRQIALLNSHENIEIRLFNPLSRGSTKAMNFFLDFNRVNRRMHNKSLTVDNSATIFGGRNIADEYFQINTQAEFADLDFFAAGPVAKDIAASFDMFWNDSRAVSMSGIVKDAPDVDFSAARRELEIRAEEAAKDVYSTASTSLFLQSIRNGDIPTTHGHARVVSDRPIKLKMAPNDGPQDLADALKKAMWNVERDFILMTPYFVPRPDDVAMLKQIRARGKRVRILTNSLASTNHATVHGGYAPARKELLRAGVELYEIRADALQAVGELPKDSDIVLTLHTKAAVFDGEQMFVGSLNYDPRSIEINTELGVFMDAPELAANFKTGVENYIRQHAYRLSLDENGEIIWTFEAGNVKEIRRNDPGATFGKRLVSGITRILPFKGQL
ncbi:phospholipase D family protein [Falsihalocynthiibacter sp. SS001]|uniref:phospholipase D family protein n=1 Tax=Falsihalocynthiibacter sp. SS001 TaxID=3349698 RepID=UPI0036D2D86E